MYIVFIGRRVHAGGCSDAHSEQVFGAARTIIITYGGRRRRRRRRRSDIISIKYGGGSDGVKLIGSVAIPKTDGEKNRRNEQLRRSVVTADFDLVINAIVLCNTLMFVARENPIFFNRRT